MSTVGTLNINFATNVATLINDMQKASRSVGQTSSRISKSLDTATRAFRTLGISASAAFSVRGFARVADEMSNLSARIRNSTHDTEEFRQAFSALSATAIKTGGDLATSVEVFQRLSFVRAEIKASVAEMTQFTETVQKLGVVSGAGPAALSAGLTQLGQGLSSNVLRAEEFNSIMENIPAVGVSIATELGVTTGQLRNLVIAGEILSKDVFAAILNQSQKANEQFEQMPMTIARAMGSFRAELKLAVVEMDGLSNGSKIMIAGIGVAGNLLKALAGVVSGWVNIYKAMFAALTGGIIQAINFAMAGVQKLINLGIRGINVLKKEDIPLFKFDMPVDTAGLSAATFDDFQDKMRRSAEGFKQAAGGAFGAAKIVFGVDSGIGAAAVNPVREISKDYAALAEKIGDLGGKSKSAADKVKDLSRAAKDSRDNFRSAAVQGVGFFGDQLTQLVNKTKSAREIIVSLLADIGQNLIRVGMGQPAGGGLGGSIASFLAGGFSAASFVSASGTAGFSSRSFGALTGAAMGGAYGPGFATGGGFTVGGKGGTDANFIGFRATKGEDVMIRTRRQQQEGRSGDTYYIDARGADQAGIARLEAMIRATQASIQPMAVAAVESKFKRTNSYLK